MEKAPGKQYNVGSRKSQLAVVQTERVVDEITKINPRLSCKIVTYSTTGDMILNEALSKIGEKSLFTKELEIALLNHEVDFVVHSLKDMQTTLNENLVIAAILEREDPRDVLILHPSYSGYTIKSLPENSILGSSSLRRIAQLKGKYPHLEFNDIRGNLNTRLKKLDNDNHYAGIVLAAAGVKRMGWEDRVSEYLCPETCLYAVGQGALAVECRKSDIELVKLLNQLSDRSTVLRCVAERTLLKSVEGGCSVPLGVNSALCDNQLTLTAGLFDLDGGNKAIVSSEVDLDGTKESNHEDQYPLDNLTSVLMLNIELSALEMAHKLGAMLGEKLLLGQGKSILQRVKDKKMEVSMRRS